MARARMDLNLVDRDWLGAAALAHLAGPCRQGPGWVLGNEQSWELRTREEWTLARKGVLERKGQRAQVETRDARVTESLPPPFPAENGEGSVLGLKGSQYVRAHISISGGLGSEGSKQNATRDSMATDYQQYKISWGRCC